MKEDALKVVARGRLAAPGSLGRLDGALDFVDVTVRALMRAGQIEGKMLGAQVRPQRLRIVRTISDAPEQSRLRPAALV